MGLLPRGAGGGVSLMLAMPRTISLTDRPAFRSWLWHSSANAFSPPSPPTSWSSSGSRFALYSGDSGAAALLREMAELYSACAT